MNIFFVAIENITILNCNVYILFSYVDNSQNTCIWDKCQNLNGAPLHLMRRYLAKIRWSNLPAVLLYLIITHNETFNFLL